MSNVKCPQCGLVNFADAEKCKRCGADLAGAPEAVAPRQSADTAAPDNPKLAPCPDCGKMISKNAESCPQCGRFFQRFGAAVVVDQKGWAGTIAWGVIFSWLVPGLIILIVVVFFFLLGEAAHSR
jgi:RNA polymerase subunit RPABC4/transcription elongation factor Spt4